MKFDKRSGLAWCALACCLLLPSAIVRSVAQTVASPQTTSDPRALAVIDTAITALGGRASWQRVGAATAEATVASQNGTTRTVNWTNDWSTGRIRFRRDAAPGTSSATLVGTDSGDVHVKASGSTEPLLHNNGVAVSAINYPAVALIVSLTKYQCSFHLGQAVNPRLPLADPDPDEVAVTETCPDPYYPQGFAQLVWVFSKSSSLPKSVQVPIWGNTHHIVLSETVTYVAFQNTHGLVAPSQLHIARPNGRIDTLTISDTNFLQAIPDSTFTVSKQ